VRENPKRYPCQDHPKLVEALAGALLKYECWLRALQDESESLKQGLMRRLDDMNSLVHHFMWLRRKEKLPVHVPLPYKQTTVIQAFRRIAGIIQAITPDDFVRMSQYSRSRCRRDLIRGMQEEFTRYGPMKYPTAAAFRTIAAILLQLGIEPGREEGKTRHAVIQTVADRLYKFMQRATD
jgi:hypothetical protein